jgi:hypothetical protein
VRAKFHRAREIARRVAGEALPTWACMEAVAAEALSALGSMPSDAREAACETADLSGACWTDRAGPAGIQDPPLPNGAAPPIDAPDGSMDPSAGLAGAPMANVCAMPPSADPPLAPVANVCAPPPPVWVRSLVEGIDDADAFELDDRMRRAVALEQRIEAEMAPLLRALGESLRYRHAGAARFESWARERLGISPRKTRALVRLDRAGDACPALREAFRSGRLSWVQAHALAPILLVAELAPFRDEWVVWAEGVSVRRLEDDVAAALLLLETDRAAFAATGGLPERQTCARDPRSVDHPEKQAPASVREDETARIAFVGPRDAAVFICAVVAAARGRLERLTGRSVSAGEAIEWMLDHALAAWGADDPLLEPEHRVFERDGWRCTMPGCSSYRNLHDHHIVYRSKGGPDELWNRTTLCACHHQRGVHGGLVRCTGSAPEGLRFELGLRAGRPPLLRYTAGDRRVSARVA